MVFMFPAIVRPLKIKIFVCYYTILISLKWIVEFDSLEDFNIVHLPQMILNTFKPIIYDFFFIYLHATCILCADDWFCSLNITSNLTKISFKYWW